jgi:hypothetical protein
MVLIILMSMLFAACFTCKTDSPALVRLLIKSIVKRFQEENSTIAANRRSSVGSTISSGSIGNPADARTSYLNR